jgi:hypothetical protein
MIKQRYLCKLILLFFCTNVLLILFYYISTRENRNENFWKKKLNNLIMKSNKEASFFQSIRDQKLKYLNDYKNNKKKVIRNKDNPIIISIPQGYYCKFLNY